MYYKLEVLLTTNISNKVNKLVNNNKLKYFK
jgi:hypothetical protein